MQSLPVEAASANVSSAQADLRPRLYEPPPVRLITVDDASLIARAGVERELDDFYVTLLKFEREPDAEFPVYRAANFRIRFDVLEPPVKRDDLRALGIEVQSLAEVEHQLIEREIDYTRHRGLLPGQLNLCLLDPAGNWIEISESRAIG